jgi:hypothetical protein
MAMATSRPAGADGQHAQRPGRAGVAVRPQERFARFAESLHVDGVTDPVAGTAVPDTEAFAGTLQKQVIVGVLVVLLDQVVIDVLHRDFCAHPLQSHGFQGQHHQSAGGILGQRLVDFDPNLGAGSHGARNEMGCDQFLGEVSGHVLVSQFRQSIRY